MTRTLRTSLGELVSTAYEELLARYGDADLAAVAASAIVNDLLSGGIPHVAVPLTRISRATLL